MLDIITAEQRMQKRTKTNIVIVGASGAGKTTQVRTLPPQTTLFLDLEAGTLAIEGEDDSQPWSGDLIKVRDMALKLNLHPWVMLKVLTVLICGPDPLADQSDSDFTRATYSARHYASFFGIAKPEQFDKYDTIFADSLTVAARWCFNWCKTQPEAKSAKTGQPDIRGAYGLLGQEMVTWLTILQHSPKSIVAAAILDEKKDDFGRIVWEIQMEGSKTGLELPGIFDEVVTLANLKDEAGNDTRVFVCNKINPWGFPAKDRSGRLNVVEPPHLGNLIHKMKNGPRLDSNIITTMTANPIPQTVPLAK